MWTQKGENKQTQNGITLAQSQQEDCFYWNLTHFFTLYSILQKQCLVPEDKPKSDFLK